MKHQRPDDWNEIVRAECYDGDCVYKELDTFEDGADAMYEALKAHFPKSEDIRLMLVQEKFGDRTLNDIVAWIKREVFGE